MGGKELRAIFGKNVRLYRNRRNWSQADLAEYANISINFLGDIERGKKWPHPDTLTKMADALEIKVFELFLEEDMAVNPKTKTLMKRFVKDISLTINKSLSLSVNQSIEHIRKQYNLS
jgi:transcriptional regulator with XRE-family HTH domain